MVVAMATLLAFFHLPLPWYRRRRAGDALHLRRRRLGGAVCRRSPSPASTPSASPRRRGCSPTRCRRPNSCCSASSISPRSTAWPPPPRTSSARRLRRSRWSPARWSARSATTRSHAEDVKLLRSQSERCREILKRLDQPVDRGRGASGAPAAHLAGRGGDRAAPRFRHRHQARARRAASVRSRSAGAIPASSTASAISSRTPSTSPGRASPCAGAGTTSRSRSTIVDDGPGFPPEIIDRIGEPYMSTRQGDGARRRAGARPVHRQDAARTLGRDACPSATRATPGEGAVVEIVWPRDRLPRPAAGCRTDVRHGLNGRRNWTSRLTNLFECR